MVNARQKGAVAEREVAALLREFGFLDAKRGQQRSGLEQADVVGGPPGFHLEIKRTEKLQLWAAWAQAVRDADHGETPVVVTRRSKEPWLAVLPFERLLELIVTIDDLRAVDAPVKVAQQENP